MLVNFCVFFLEAYDSSVFSVPKPSKTKSRHIIKNTLLVYIKCSEM